MDQQNAKYLDQIKELIVKKMRSSYPGIPESIADWKGDNITDFQNELRENHHAHISEKWFYTHMKTKHRSLPRIDMLNILSSYVGYRNWEDFKHRYSASGNSTGQKSDRSNRVFYFVPILTLIILAVMIFIIVSC